MSRYKNIFEIIEEIKPKSILEVGTWNGVHAEQMIRAANKHTDLIYYFGFDLFEDFTQAEVEFCPKKPANFNAVNKRLLKLEEDGEGILDFILIKGNTHKTLAEFNTALQPIDFIFMDGGHSLETIESDWLNLQKFIGQNTTVLLDDCYINNRKVGCRNLVDKLMFDAKWLVEPLEPIDPCNEGTQMVRVNLNL